MKTLLELVSQIGELDDEDVIFARPDWTSTSDAAVFRLTEAYTVPEEPGRLGLRYFLEVAVAREVLEGFARNQPATAQERCRRLIQYAMKDA